MDKLLKIKEVATKYSITKRTLRYYEEIGILSTIRKEDSNYRYYDNESLSRLEQIILLKSLNFQISEIREIILSKDEEFIDNMLQDKLIKIQNEIDNLYASKELISSILKIKNKQGTSSINFYQVIREQIYIHKNIERRIHMNQYAGDMIILEFGINIVPYAQELIDNIKEYRKQIEKTTNKELPLIRIRDVESLKDDEYRIVIKDVVVKNQSIENVDDNKKVMKIITELKESINSNHENLFIN
ncbi:MerR family transcriptional regulator [Oceanirhabdus sp. W0125-5]|uniref:MerR family transcriptional regulator n=1 Tax=Oceanirhabdus sp. W0125-5 TaxID=2999116 RepID=UPI0022F2F69A|nr:MerR family transcriptional regulator [Oceanirhabdus sp. W0125-5]WBW96189.1 MerR family transcriptional regulator [Oceanirhabdus sp. W0125-5]